MSRLLDYDPFTGISTTVEYIEATDETVVGYEQDVEPILEANAVALGDLDAHKRAAKNEWAHYARVPLLLIEKWKQELGVDFFNRDHSKKVMKLINDRDYSKVKVTTYSHDR